MNWIEFLTQNWAILLFVGGMALLILMPSSNAAPAQGSVTPQSDEDKQLEKTESRFRKMIYMSMLAKFNRPRSQPAAPPPIQINIIASDGKGSLPSSKENRITLVQPHEPEEDSPKPAEPNQTAVPGAEETKIIPRHQKASSGM